jgi:RimJ/RimL family protein N-acetyltransferase
MNTTNYLFETNRLRIRHWNSADVQDAFVIYGDPVVQSTLRDDGRPVRDLTEMAQSLATNIASRKAWAPRKGHWAIVHKELGVVIGSVSFDDIPCDDGRPSGEIEVTWALARKYWGFGYASEAAKGAIGYGFAKNPTLVRVTARCRPHHKASRLVADRIGMSFAGMTTKFGGMTLAIYEMASTSLNFLA